MQRDSTRMSTLKMNLAVKVQTLKGMCQKPTPRCARNEVVHFFFACVQCVLSP